MSVTIKSHIVGYRINFFFNSTNLTLKILKVKSIVPTVKKETFLPFVQPLVQ